MLEGDDSELIGYALLVQLESKSKNAILLMECVRVLEHVRGKGIGKSFVCEVLNVARDLARGRPLKLYSTTIQENVAMRRVFSRTSFKEVGIAHIWPRRGIVQKCTDCESVAEMPSVTGVQVPQSKTGRWNRLQNSRTIMDTLTRFSLGEFVPMYFSVESLDSMGCKYSTCPKCSVWELHGETSRSLLLVDLSNNPWAGYPVLSAFVTDIRAAEETILFMLQFPRLRPSAVVFDIGLTSDVIDSSTCLSYEDFYPFIVMKSEL